MELYGNNNYLSSKFVIAYLDIPGQRRIPIKDTFTFKFDNTTFQVKDLGMEYLALQIELTQSNTQPVLCFLDTNLNRYGELLFYTIDKKEVIDFIESGIRK